MDGFKNRYSQTLLGGFTLIEILVILGVLSILTGLILSGGIAAKKRSKIYQAKTMIASLETALALYHVDFGAYPAAGNQNLVNLLSDSTAYSSNSDWHGPYLSFKENDLNGNIPSATVIDPWGADYYYTMDSALPYKIWSRGPDQIDDSGANDDIKSW